MASSPLLPDPAIFGPRGIQWILRQGNSHTLNLQSQMSAVRDCKLIALISKVLLDDGNRISNPQGIFTFFFHIYHSPVWFVTLLTAKMVNFTVQDFLL